MMIRVLFLFLLTAPAWGATWFVDGDCANNGNGTADGCAASAGAAGAWNNLTSASQSSSPVSPGDTVRIHAATYPERWLPQRSGTTNNYITYQAFGDGNVVIDCTNIAIGSDTGCVFMPVSANVHWLRFLGLNDSNRFITVNNGVTGTAGSKTGYKDSGWTVHGNNGRGATKVNGTNLVFDWIESSNFSKGAFFACNDCTIDHAHMHNTGTWGMWLDWPMRARVLNSEFHDCGESSSTNKDCLNVQDGEFIRFKDITARGVYDCIDVGSQLAAGPGVVGPRYVQVINATVDGPTCSNSPIASSTLTTGPTFFYGVVCYDTLAWGCIVSYESSRNVEYWNITCDRAIRCINTEVNAAAGAYFQGANLLAWSRNSGGDAVPAWAIATASSQVFNLRNSCYRGTVAPAKTSGPNGESFGNTADCLANFVDRAGKDYRLTSNNPVAIDGGTFLTEAKRAGTATTQLITSKDPRTYFWAGDVIQIEGVGQRTVVSLSATTITLNSPATFTQGAGVHFPWCGARPDMGAFEFGLDPITNVCS